jgi:hypothetical protein
MLQVSFKCDSIREAIKKKSPKVGTLSQPPLTPAELGTPYLVKTIIIAYFNSTAYETNFKHGL